MEIKPNVNLAKETAIAIMRDREKFWAKASVPKDIGPLVSYLMVIGVAPFIGYILYGAVAWYITMGRAAGLAVGQYISALIMPLIAGAIMSVVANMMKAKGKFLDYATIATYSATPGLLAAFFVFIPALGGLLGLLGALFGLYLLYLGLMKLLKMDSGQAIIFIIVYMVVWFVIAWAMSAALIGGGIGMWGTGAARGIVVY